MGRLTAAPLSRTFCWPHATVECPRRHRQRLPPTLPLSRNISGLATTGWSSVRFHSAMQTKAKASIGSEPAGRTLQISPASSQAELTLLQHDEDPTGHHQTARKHQRQIHRKPELATLQASRQISTNKTSPLLHASKQQVVPNVLMSDKCARMDGIREIRQGPDPFGPTFPK
jgi:hypothetical protein